MLEQRDQASIGDVLEHFPASQGLGSVIGLLALAAASGVADVDAITLSLARISQDDLALPVAVTGIVIAAAVNSVVKGCMAAFIGGRKIGLRVGAPLLVGATGGLLSTWLWVW